MERCVDCIHHKPCASLVNLFLGEETEFPFEAESNLCEHFEIPKHGEWIKYPSDAYMKCSVCGMEYEREKMPSIVGYCPNPNCGAKMDGERKDTQCY